MLRGLFDLRKGCATLAANSFKPQRISQFDSGFRIIIVFGQLHAVFIVVLCLASLAINELKTKKQLHRKIREHPGQAGKTRFGELPFVQLRHRHSLSGYLSVQNGLI